MTIPLQSGLVYGPVNSRRLGRSLGVNIVSTKIKTCTFNCVYCQYGLGRVPDENMEDINWYPNTQQIIDVLEQVLPILSPRPAYITFSGNGEPTLHPEFPILVDRVKKVRDKYAADSQVALLSNSSTVMRKYIRNTLERLDKPIMKLDCGNEAMFKRYNQPLENVLFNEIVDGLKKVDNLTIQALFSNGSGGNFTPDHLNDWIKLIKDISPNAVQIYTLARSYPSSLISPLSVEQLKLIGDQVVGQGINAEVY